MIDLFPHARATLKAHAYFLNYIEDGVFKVFGVDDAPGLDSDFITIEQSPAEQGQLSGWATATLTFSVIGEDTEKPKLWEIVNKIDEAFPATAPFAAVGDADPVEYERLGNALFDMGTNPVTEKVHVSIAMTFGIVP